MLGHCWVVLARLGEYTAGRWVGFPLRVLLFVPLATGPEGWPFQTKIALAALLLHRLRWPAQRLILVVDNLSAKATLASLALDHERYVLVSRLRSTDVTMEPVRLLDWSGLWRPEPPTW